MSEYNLGTARGQISVDGSSAQKGFNVAETAANGFFLAVQTQIKSVQQVGRRLAVMGAAGVTGFGAAVKSASAFETQISAIAAVTGSTGKEIDALRQKALLLGAKTAFSAGEAAGAIGELAKAGVSVKDILNGAASATVNLAAAGGIDLPQAATIAANSMNQFGIEGKNAAHVADIFAGAANASSADVSDLGMALSQVGAVAHLAGLGLDDTVTALGEFANKGIKGSDAGTSLKTMLLNLNPTTDAQIAKFKELGLLTYNNATAMRALAAKGIKPLTKGLDGARAAVAKYLIKNRGLKEGTQKLKQETDKYLQVNGALKNQFFDQKGNVKDLRGLQDALAKSTRFLSDGETKMTKQEKLKNLEVLFGTDAMRAAAIMAETGAAGYDKFSKAAKGITAADVARKRLDNLAGSMENLRGSVETLLIKIGTPLLKPLSRIVLMVSKVINWVGQLPDPILKVITFFGLFISVMALVIGAGLALLPILAGLVLHMAAMFLIKQLIRPFYAFGKAILFERDIAIATSKANVALERSIFRTGVAAKFTKIMIKLLALSFKILRFAISPVGLLLIALAVGLVLLYKHNKRFKEIVDRVAKVLQGVFLRALKNVEAFIQRMKPKVEALGKAFMTKVLPVLEKFGQIVLQYAVKALKKLYAIFVNDIIPALIKFGGFVKNVIIPAIERLIPVIVRVGKAFGKYLAATFKPVIDSVKKDLIPAFKDFANTFLVVSRAIGKNFGPTMAFIGKQIAFATPYVLKFSEYIGKHLGKAIAFILPYIFKFVAVLLKINFAILRVVLPIMAKIVAFILDKFLKGFVEAIVGIIKVASGIIKIFTGINNFFTGLFTGNWTKMWNGIKQIFSGVWLIIVGAFKVFMATIGNTFVSIMKVIGKVALAQLTFLLGLFVKLGALILGAVIGAFKAVGHAISSLVRGGINAAASALSSLAGIAWSAIGRVVGAIRGRIKAVAGAMVSIAHAMLHGIAGIGGDLYTKARAIIQRIIDGILSKIKDVGGAMKKIASKIGKFIPGSPVREGPLKKINRGRAGGRIAQMIADGITSRSDAVKKAMRNLTDLATAQGGLDLALSASGTFNGIADSKAATPTVSTPPGMTTTPTERAAKNSGLRMVSGIMKTDKGFGVYVKGQAVEVVDSDQEFQDIIDNMKKPR